MENFKMYFLLILSLAFSSYALQAQMNNDRETVARVYDLLQTRGTGPAEVAMLTQKIHWAEVSSPLNERYHISFPAIMKNQWQSLQFQDLNFTEIEKNKVKATGTVLGRQPSECGVISTDFRHSWSLHNGEIVGFSE
ncbi:MAG: hypothetical protein WBL27_00315 [Salinimicrobium sp.]